MADELKPRTAPAPWLHQSAAIPDSTEAEVEAFGRVCETLAGFNGAISFDSVDGFLTALAALPQPPAVDRWLGGMCGDAFERAFADPAAQAEAQAALERRLAVLCAQLDPAEMFDDAEGLRLAPLMAEITDEDRARFVAEGMDPEDAECELTGAWWADGFFEAVALFEGLWTPPAGEEAQAAFDTAFAQIDALRMDPTGDAWRAHCAKFWPQGEPSRDQIITEACYAVQDLRLFWVDFAPITAPRKAEATPGRNDPCPCGSGKKYKKCHGAAA